MLTLKGFSRLAFIISSLVVYLWSGTGIAGYESNAEIDALQKSDCFSTVGIHYQSKGGEFTSFSSNFIGLDAYYPAGTKFKLEHITREEIQLTELQNNRKLKIIFNPKHHNFDSQALVLKLFSIKAPETVKGFSTLESQSMSSGKVYVGISRKALSLAIGFPPDSINTISTADAEVFQVKRFNKVKFLFKNEKVVKIED